MDFLIEQKEYQTEERQKLLGKSLKTDEKLAILIAHVA